MKVPDQQEEKAANGRRSWRRASDDSSSKQVEGDEVSNRSTTPSASRHYGPGHPGNRPSGPILVRKNLTWWRLRIQSTSRLNTQWDIEEVVWKVYKERRRMFRERNRRRKRLCNIFIN